MGTRDRRFTLLDAMILIASTAAGLAGVRYYYPDNFIDFGRSSIPWGIWVINWMVGSLPLFLAWTLAFVVLRVRKPRPTIRRLSRQPGLVAGLAVSLILAGGTMTFAGVYVVDQSTFHHIKALLYRGGYWGGATRIIPFCFGPAVATAWMVLILGGRWRPEPSWIDRFGRLLGGFWVVWTPFHLWAFLGL